MVLLVHKYSLARAMTAQEKHRTKIEKLLSDKKSFQDYVYTPPMEAIKELKRRWSDDLLKPNTPIPKIFETGFKAVLHRQLVTPNYELLRFMIIADGFNFEPVFFEYLNDKFVTESEWKYCLGSLHFFFGYGKKGGIKIQRQNIINFNEANGKKIGDIKTTWGQKLADFHHELFAQRFPDLSNSIYDGSKWYAQNGGCAKEYYKPFLSLFLKHGILFENFLLDNKELCFSREVFLPALLEVEEEYGVKPLIVALEPTDFEEDIFWTCYPPENKRMIEEKTKSSHPVS